MYNNNKIYFKMEITNGNNDNGHDHSNYDNDITMATIISNNDEKNQKKNILKNEFLNFLKTHTVYETIPENMKVTQYLYKQLKNYFDRF
jgi:hypothetical protein